MQVCVYVRARVCVLACVYVPACVCVSVSVTGPLDGFSMCVLAAEIWLDWKSLWKVHFFFLIFIYEHNKGERKDIVAYMHENEGNKLFVSGNLFLS